MDAVNVAPIATDRAVACVATVANILIRPASVHSMSGIVCCVTTRHREENGNGRFTVRFLDQASLRIGDW
jgi:hypothetical protein